MVHLVNIADIGGMVTLLNWICRKDPVMLEWKSLFGDMSSVGGQMVSMPHGYVGKDTM